MLFATSIAASDSPSFPTAMHQRTIGRMGWFCIAENAIKVATSPDMSGYIANYNNGARLRWRGAAAKGAGTKFRNRHWTSAAANSKQIPMSFQANSVVSPMFRGV